MLTYTFYLDLCWPWWAQNPTTEMKMLVCLPYCCQAMRQAVLPVSISSLPSSTTAYLHRYSGQGAFVLLILPEKWGIWRKGPFFVWSTKQCEAHFRSTVLHELLPWPSGTVMAELAQRTQSSPALTSTVVLQHPRRAMLSGKAWNTLLPAQMHYRHPENSREVSESPDLCFGANSTSK